MKKLGLCLSCDGFFEVSADATPNAEHRCPDCRDTLTYRGKYGSKIVVGVISQRELAKLKSEFYRVEEVVSALEKRKGEFIQAALAQAEQLVKDVEAQIGQPVKELRDRRDALKTKLQEYMSQSGNTEMRIRDLLLTLRNEIVNPGNRPQPTKIYEELRRLAGLTEDELRDIIRANYSQPQYADVLRVQKLPPGKRTKVAPPVGGGTPTANTAKYDAEDLELPKIAEIETRFSKSAAQYCRVNSPEGTFILTGDLVRRNGLAYMIGLQKQTKAHLKVSDAENRPDGTILVLVDGPFVSDPNTVRAFLADRSPDYEISDILYPNNDRVAVELSPVGGDPMQKALAYFDSMGGIVDSLLATEQMRAEVATGLPQYVTGASVNDLVDNTDDLSLKYERQNTNPSGTGGRGSPQEGIMSPEKDPTGAQFYAAGNCATPSCGRKLTANSRDPIDNNICIWCGLESEARA